MFMDKLYLELPNRTQNLYPGAKIRLGRFEKEVWEVCYGWYAWGNNRPVCGWYLVNSTDPGIVKPLQLPDLDDIMFVKY